MSRLWGIVIAVALCCLGFKAGADTLTWRNNTSDFNVASSWDNTSPLGPDRVPTFDDLADFSGLGNVDPVVQSTTSVFGVRFGSVIPGVASDYILSSSPAAQLVVLGGGIAGQNTSGANTISAALVLNDNQSVTQAAGGTLTISGAVVLGGNTSGGAQGSALTIGSTGGNGTINFNPSAVELAGNLALTTNVNVALPGIALLSAPGTTAGLTKSGAATLSIAGGSSYDGPTAVNAGTLLAMNSAGVATGTGAVAVNSGGTLGGTGAVGETTVNAGGQITGGDMGTTGALTLQSLTFAGTSSSFATYVVDLTSSASDTLSILGNLDLGGAFDRIQFQGTAGAASYEIATYRGSLAGTFDSVMNLPAGYTLQYDSGSINLVVVPEPGTWLAGAFALGSIAWLRRERIRRAMRL